MYEQSYHMSLLRRKKPSHRSDTVVQNGRLELINHSLKCTTNVCVPREPSQAQCSRFSCSAMCHRSSDQISTTTVHVFQICPWFLSPLELKFQWSSFSSWERRNILRSFKITEERVCLGWVSMFWLGFSIEMRVTQEFSMCRYEFKKTMRMSIRELWFARTKLSSNQRTPLGWVFPCADEMWPLLITLISSLQNSANNPAQPKWRQFKNTWKRTVNNFQWEWKVISHWRRS